MNYRDNPLWVAAMAATDPHMKVCLLGELGTDLPENSYESMLSEIGPELAQDVDDYVQWTGAQYVFDRDLRGPLKCVRYDLSLFAGYLTTYTLYEGRHMAYEWAALIGRAAVLLSSENAPGQKWKEAFVQIKQRMK